MKRFFREARAVEAGRVFRIELDGKPVKTPGRRAFELSAARLAEAVAREWQDQGDEIDPRRMPLTQLANAAIDRVRPERETVIADVAAYGGADLLCYRVESPPDLRDRQDSAWQPVLDRLESEKDVGLRVTRALRPVDQPQEALRKIYTIVAGFDDFGLAALMSATTITGSVALGIALAEGWVDADRAWALAYLDEIHQEELWGSDSEASARRKNAKSVISDAGRFLNLAGWPPR